MTDIAELHARQRRIGIVRAQGRFVDRDRARRILFGVGQAVLAERDLAERGQHGGDVGMIGAKRLLADGEGALQRGFGLGHFALRLKGLRENHQRGRGHRRLPAGGSFGLALELSGERNGFAVASVLGQRRDALHQRQHVLGARLARQGQDAGEHGGTDQPRNESMECRHAAIAPNAYQCVCYCRALGPQQGEGRILPRVADRVGK